MKHNDSCSPWTFYIRQPRNSDGSEGQSVGEIRKQWSGILKEMLTDADNFGTWLRGHTRFSL